MSLSDFHREELTKYIKFFKSKREVQVSELSETFQDAIETRLEHGALMNEQEVAALLESLGASVKSTFDEDLRRTVSMSVLAIQQLLEDADAQGLELHMDTSKIEDSHLVDEIEKLAALATRADRKAGAGRLVSLRDEQMRTMEQIQRQEEKLKEISKERDNLADKLESAQNTISNMTYETQALKKQIDLLKNGADSPQEGKVPEHRSVLTLQEELDDKRDENSRLRAELEDARDLLLSTSGFDLADIKNTRQFVQLRKTLVQKTDQLTDLRRRMLHYEPDEARIEQDFQNTPLKLRHK